MPAAGQSVREIPATLSAREAAARHVELGLRFYRAGEYGAARVEFEAPLGLSGDAELLHNLSWTAEKQGQIAAAIDYEERFLSFKGAELPTAERIASEVVEIERRLDECAANEREADHVSEGFEAVRIEH